MDERGCEWKIGWGRPVSLYFCCYSRWLCRMVLGGCKHATLHSISEPRTSHLMSKAEFDLLTVHHLLTLFLPGGAKALAHSSSFSLYLHLCNLNDSNSVSEKYKVTSHIFIQSAP